jgi:hypothetical protein
LLASDGCVTSRREYVAKDDSEATELGRAAYRIYVESMMPGYGFEVYRGVRLVARESIFHPTLVRSDPDGWHGARAAARKVASHRPIPDYFPDELAEAPADEPYIEFPP